MLYTVSPEIDILFIISVLSVNIIPTPSNVVSTLPLITVGEVRSGI